MLTLPLTYQHDSALLFERIAQQPWAMLLDSGQMLKHSTGKAGSQYGRYDIMVAEPFITMQVNGAQTEISQDAKVTLSDENPFDILNNLLKQYPAEKSALPFAGGACPFAGGALGYFGYDLGRRLEKQSLEKIASNSQPEPIPDMMIGIYDWALVVDHREKRCYLVSHCMQKNTREKLVALQALFNAASGTLSANNANDFAVTSAITSNFSQQTYTQAFDKVKAYISAGDCYQVNLAQRFSAKVQGDVWQMYKKLRQLSPAPFMAYMNLPLDENDQFQVLSNSPERFLQTDGNHVETRPIKGTRPRSNNAEQDLAYSNELLTSAKDKAENVMIVDLLRNDLSKNCQIGSVKTTKLFQLQSFANVHHLVSIVIGKLKAGKTAVDVLRGSFPGGSITGAPKLRAMQIIEELEPHRRGIYCGAIGYISFDGNMDTNIAIRTAVCAKNHLSFYAGGGIIADSDGTKEYAETLDKASSFTTIIKLFTRH